MLLTVLIVDLQLIIEKIGIFRGPNEWPRANCASGFAVLFYVRSLIERVWDFLQILGRIW